MNMDRFDLNPRRNHREDAAIPPDLVGTDRLLTRVLGRSPHAADDVDSLSAVRSLAELTLVALLRDSSHNASDPLDAMVGAAYRGPAFGGRAGGIARGEVGILGYGRAAGVAVPVLQTRGAGLDDFEDELGAILGSNEA